MEDGVKLFLSAEKLLPDYENSIAHGRQLREIEKIVQGKLKEGIPFDTGTYFLAHHPGDPYRAYVELIERQKQPKSAITNDPGIPFSSLHDTRPIAQWVIKQLATKSPNLFKC